MSNPYALPVGPTRLAESSTSIPPPDPKSSTTSPACNFASAVGFPHPSEAATAPAGLPAAPATRRPSRGHLFCRLAVLLAHDLLNVRLAHVVLLEIFFAKSVPPSPAQLPGSWCNIPHTENSA